MGQSPRLQINLLVTQTADSSTVTYTLVMLTRSGVLLKTPHVSQYQGGCGTAMQCYLLYPGRSDSRVSWGHSATLHMNCMHIKTAYAQV